MGLSFTYILLPVLILIGIRKIQTFKWGKCSNTVNLRKKVAIVTGANSGIGYEIVKDLAVRNAHVILACRNIRRAHDAIVKVEKEVPNSSLIPMELDLASLKSVKQFADLIKLRYSEIHLLINNAGVAYPNNIKEKTKDGFEVHFGTNHLGHFFLTNLLLDTIKATKGSRIIIVSSKLHEKGTIYLDDLNIENVSSTNAYANSKLANIYFCNELAKRLDGSGVNVYALNPGWVYTNLFRHYSLEWYKLIFIIPIAFLFMRSSEQGAQTALYCATEPKLEDESGFLYSNCKKCNSNVVIDPIISSKLWDLSENCINKVMS